MLAVGGERIMELTTNGDVVSWGGNQYGELGDYTHLDSANPVHVVGLTNIVKIASGMNHSLAIDADGVLWAWGDNRFGQLGDGGMEDGTNVPVQVVWMTNAAIAVASGYSHSVAVKADGTVWTWGDNESGQLGNGGTDDANVPVQVQGLPTNAVTVAAGYSHTLALLGDGTVWAWGGDNLNQLGDGLRTESDTPVQVPGLTGIAAICTGGNHNLALHTNGNVWAWGSDNLNSGNVVIHPLGAAGKFAKANAEDNGNWPAMVAGLTNVIGLAAGTSHFLALDNEGRLWAFGSDVYGQLGDGGPDNNGGQYNADIPMQVLSMTNIIAMAAGSDASVALDGNGNLWQCGDSDGDETRDGDTMLFWPWGDENGFPVMAPAYYDFYNGQPPDLTILNGNNQTPHAGLEFPQPLVFQVTDTNGVVLSNAPVSVEVIAGDMELRIVSGGDNYKGLRLTTDANGKVSLIGYSDQDISNSNCIVRVLAASREQIVEVDFNETLVSPPTISITSPTNGSHIVLRTNQALTITVDAEAAPGDFIQEVDYYYGTNETADTLLGVSTQSPYSFIWTNNLWWTNAFLGQYTLSAVAVDDAGILSDPQSVNITIALDSDGGGLPDYWQLQYFGHLNMDPNSTTDRSGRSLLYDYQNGIDPNVIAFTLSATNHYVNQTTVPLQINLQSGVPGYIAVLVNDTNLADASWQVYTDSNVLISLGSDDGDYDVWVGLRGWVTNLQPVWQGTLFTLGCVSPTLAVTNPVSTLVSQPVIQLQGYASKPLASLTYDLTNAAEQITNQPGFITGQYADTNLRQFTTNYFQCYDVPLTNGVNTFTLHATDLAGNTTTTNISFTLDYSGDTTPPVLALVWPQDGTSIGGSSFSLQARVDDATAQVVACIVDASGDTNTVQGLVERNGLVWAYNLPLAAGLNTLTVTATDVAGNSSVTNISLFQGPITVTMNLLPSDQLNQSFVSVSGAVSDASCAVTVNGVTATVNSDGTWEADNVSVNPGGTAVFDVEVYSGGSSPAVSNLKTGRSVQANDAGGNTSVEFLQIKPPVVQAISYLENDVINQVGFFFSLQRQWNLGTGGTSVREWVEEDDQWSSIVFWPDYWPGGEGVCGTISDFPGISIFCETTPHAWLNVSLESGSGAGKTSLRRHAQTAIQLTAGGPAQADGPQLIRLTASAAAYSPSGVDALYIGGDLFYPTYSLEFPGNVPLPVSAIKILGQTLTPTATNANVGEMLLSLTAGETRNVTPTVTTSTNADEYSFNVQAFEVIPQLAVDANRDGNITFDQPGQTNPDQTSASNPYRFWVNNDYDRFDPSIGDYADLEPPPGTRADNLNTTISCTRDLEDHTRLWINTAGIIAELQNGTVLLALEWKTVTVGYPGIRIFPAVETNGGTLYLTDEGTAQAQTNAPYGNCLNGGGVDEIQGSLPFIIPTNFWSVANVSSNQPVAHLLFDAVSRGSGKLVISIYKNDGVTKLGETQPLYLNLQDVKEMYERWTVGESGAPATTATLVTSPYQYDSSITAENNYILFVHGWNLAPWERDAFAETAFKRLYWQGYKGHFGAFQWPTLTGNTTFDQSELVAWQSAEGLRKKLDDLNSSYPGNVYLMAHSMGNVVAGEALKLEGPNQRVNTYVAMQAAVASHAYDASATSRALDHTGVNLDSGTPNRYANYYTNGAPCYFNGVQGAGTYVNIYNADDWALATAFFSWEADQDSKPDSLRGYGFIQDTGQFFKDQYNTELIFPYDRYEIFAACDEARCYALGAQADVGGAFKKDGVSQQINLELPPYNFYNQHKDHSGEFNSDNMNRAAFWDSVLGRFGFTR